MVRRVRPFAGLDSATDYVGYALAAVTAAHRPYIGPGYGDFTISPFHLGCGIRDLRPLSPLSGDSRLYGRDATYGGEGPLYEGARGRPLRGYLRLPFGR
jgi:hypothetical protein